MITVGIFEAQAKLGGLAQPAAEGRRRVFTMADTPLFVVDCSVSIPWLFEAQVGDYPETALATGLPLATRDAALRQAAEASGVGVWQPGSLLA